MKKSKKIILITILMIVIIFIIFLFYKNKSNIIKIEYSFSNKYGNVWDTATKYITFTKDGNVRLSNSYNLYTEITNIGTDKFNELSNYIYKRKSLFNQTIEDGNNTSKSIQKHFTVILDDGTTYKLDEYALSNKKFYEIEDKINEIINDKIMNQYIKNIRKNDSLFK